MIGQVTGINSLHKVAENAIRIRNLFSVTLFPVYGMIGLQHISNGLPRKIRYVLRSSTGRS